jgi:LacI family transcriptional regulator
MTARGNGQRTTLRQVAQAAGVSTATVTRTLQNSPRVEADTRQRVTEAIKRLGYSPNPMARSLRAGGREGAVGLVTGGFTNLFQAGVAAGAERELRRAGLNLIIGTTDEDPSREPELARAMIDRRVGVLMMMPDADEREYLSPENTFGTPVILVGRPAHDLDADVVMTEDDHAVHEATTQLLELGHRRIAALAGLPETFRARQRLAGHRAALAEHGTPDDPALVVTGLVTPGQACAAVAELMDTPSPPTAVIALNLGISDGVLLDRISHHRRYAYIAFDENDLSAGLGVSAVVRDPQEVGRQAAILALSHHRDPDRPSRIVDVPSRLVRRGSGEIPVEDT